MATKSTISVYIDDDAGTPITFQSDASGYALISMSDGQKSVQMKLSDVKSHKLKNVLVFADGLRAQVPTS